MAENSIKLGSQPLKGKRELFAQKLSFGNRNQTEAARAAGYKDNKGLRRYAHDLATNTNIKARIAFLRAKLAEKLDITREKQAQKLQQVIDTCTKSGDHTNVVAAIREQNKLFGLITERIETTEGQRQLDATERREAKRIAKLLQEPDSIDNTINVSSSGT